MKLQARVKRLILQFRVSGSGFGRHNTVSDTSGGLILTGGTISRCYKTTYDDERKYVPIVK